MLHAKPVAMWSEPDFQSGWFTTSDPFTNSDKTKGKYLLVRYTRSKKAGTITVFSSFYWWVELAKNHSCSSQFQVLCVVILNKTFDELKEPRDWRASSIGHFCFLGILSFLLFLVYIWQKGCRMIEKTNGTLPISLTAMLEICPWGEKSYWTVHGNGICLSVS